MKLNRKKYKKFSKNDNLQIYTFQNVKFTIFTSQNIVLFTLILHGILIILLDSLILLYVIKTFFNKQIYIISVQNINQSELRFSKMKTIDQYSYSTFDTIGKGYSSQVYKGKNQKTNQQVAVKLIDLKFIKGQVHRKLLQNQISVLKQLKHEQNIIQLYDVYNTKTNTCIVTQLCDQDLSKTIKNKKCIAQADALTILKQIINGYRAIHGNDIIHRDLKPANIFFSSQKIKIADFGFAVKASEIKKRESYNVGSPVYMPYEALNDNVYSFKSDIWAIGVIYYQMLTGKTPWRAKTQSDLKRMLKTVSIKTILPSKLSKVSQDFLIRTLTFEPQNRMSADQLCRFFQKSGNELQMSIQPRRMFSQMNEKLRTRAASQDNQSRNTTGTEFMQNNNISGPRTFKKINILKGIGQETTYEAKFLKTRATIKQKSSNDGSFQEIDPKKISNQLVSQLHLCRFLFKLIQRIEKNQLVDEGQKLRYQMSEVIFKKLDGLKNLTLLDGEVATQFRNSSQFTKLYKICEQYHEKYAKVLSFNQNLYLQHPSGSGSLDQIIQTQIKNLYNYVIQYQVNPQEVRDEVILLDYLITLKQLLTLAERASLQQFQKRSKIQDIVEGKPTLNITKDHITAINTKIKAMKILI